MPARLTWNGDESVNHVKLAAFEGIQRATVYLHSFIMRELNVSNPRPYTTPSKPGEPPRKRTGFGQRNVFYEFDRENVRARLGVRTNAKYMIFLDQGTKHIRPRPWLWIAVEKTFPVLQTLVASASGFGSVGSVGGRP